MSETVGAPIIIGGAPSTGSTLLRVLLGRHPNICAGGELAVFDKPGLLKEAETYEPDRMLGWLERGYPTEFVGASRAIFASLEGYPWTRDEVRCLCQWCESYKEVLTRFFERNLEASGTRRWLEKTPCNIYSFQKIAQIYPDAKFIHIVRDARDAITSYCKREKSVFRAVSRWYYATVSGIRYRSWPNYYEVKYEDLVSKPPRTLRNICEFLDEDFDERMLEPTLELVATRADWGLNPDDRVGEGSIGRYRTSFTKQHSAVFRHTRLSNCGIRSLPFPGSDISVLAPIELQEHLGYSTECLDTPYDFRPADILAHWQSFMRHRKTMLRLYRAPVVAHTRMVCGSAIDRSQRPLPSHRSAYREA